MKYAWFFMTVLALFLGGCKRHNSPPVSVLQEDESLVNQWYGPSHFKTQAQPPHSPTVDEHEAHDPYFDESPQGTENSTESQQDSIPTFYGVNSPSLSNQKRTPHYEQEEYDDEDYYADSEDYSKEECVFSPAGPIDLSHS